MKIRVINSKYSPFVLKPKTNKKRTIIQNYIIYLERFKDCNFIECSRSDRMNDPTKMEKTYRAIKPKIVPIHGKSLVCTAQHSILQKITLKSSKYTFG